MMNYMKDFRMIEDSENPAKLLFQLVVMVHYYRHSISITTCYQKWHLLSVHTGHLGFYADWFTTS